MVLEKKTVLLRRKMKNAEGNFQLDVNTSGVKLKDAVQRAGYEIWFLFSATGRMAAIRLPHAYFRSKLLQSVADALNPSPLRQPDPNSKRDFRV